ncbi:MAG: hypothetical protein P8J45_13825 [Phycisphaerales bacterium]|nr:hypothetical protein [Phycisphaerales bacterium]
MITRTGRIRLLPALLALAACPMACESTQSSRPAPGQGSATNPTNVATNQDDIPSTSMRSQTELIPMLRKRESDEDLNDVRSKTYLIADYSIGRIGQAVNTILAEPDLEPQQRIWLQRMKLDMARSMIGIACSEEPLSNLFQQLFILRVARTIIERDVEMNLGDRGEVLVQAITDIDSIIWSNAEIYIGQSLEPLKVDVNTWFAKYGKATKRYWWPRELGLLAAESVTTRQYVGLFAAVNRANDQIDLIRQAIGRTTFLIEHIPLMAGWQLDLDIAEALSIPEIQNLARGPEDLSLSIADLDSAVSTGFKDLSKSLASLDSRVEQSSGDLVTSLGSFEEKLTHTRDQLSRSLDRFSTNLDDQSAHISTALEQSTLDIGRSTSELSQSIEDIVTGIATEREEILAAIDVRTAKIEAKSKDMIDSLVIKIGIAVGVGVFLALILGALAAGLFLRIRPGHKATARTG